MKPSVAFVALVLSAAFLCGCASNKIVSVGPNTWQVNRGGWPAMNGFAAEAQCYEAANKFCAKRNLVMVPVSVTTLDGRVFVRNASSKLVFQGVAETNSTALRGFE